MPGFGRPDFPYSIHVERERDALRAHKKTRGVPRRDRDHLLIATWNIANLGAKDQERESECFDLLAEILGWFDLVAIQEVRDNTAAVRKLLDLMPSSWQLLFSETGGNEERFAYMWDTKAVELGQLVGKMVVEPNKYERAGGPLFNGFSRTPYLGTFHSGELALELASVHSIFGRRSGRPCARRTSRTRCSSSRATRRATSSAAACSTSTRSCSLTCGRSAVASRSTSKRCGRSATTGRCGHS